ITKTFKILEKLRPARFFEQLCKFCILLIINYLSPSQIFHLFVIGKKQLQMLNLHFGRKYHFVRLKKPVFAVF
ncbi:MAG: hypothetical protein LUD00_10505, partial [Prevotellaceae bacterium]|nr:hypothetical protein [Prevotellaceae bacterium]